MFSTRDRSQTDASSGSPRRSLHLAAWTVLLAGLTLAVASGCAASDEAAFAGAADSSNGGGGSGVGQSGAQDFGRFRGLIEDGQLPSPDTLDSVGFFNEHKFELPDPTCGEDVCLHGMFGVQGNMIDGSNCTMVAIGFNTALRPDDFERPPLNLAIAVDTSGSMNGQPIESVKHGLERMADQLGPQDRVSIVTYSSEAEVAVESTPGEDPARRDLVESVRSMSANGPTNIYGGLNAAFQQVEKYSSDDRQNRVMLLSDGQATSGIQDNDRIIELGRTHTEQGIGVTTIGVGNEFDLDLMQALSENGAGNFYFLEDPAAVEEVFVEEVSTFLVPLAEQVNIHFEGRRAYRFRAAYGTRNWTGDERDATIPIPALFRATRTSVDDPGPGGGRRGGGGIMLLELVPTPETDVLRNTPAGSEVGELTMTYREPDTGETIRQSTTIENPLEPAAAPEEGEFSTDTVEKAFVALNIFAGFRMATDRAMRGAAGSALDILEPLHENVVEWLGDNPDEDIQADREVMEQLMQIISQRSGETATRVGQQPNPWPRD